MKKIFLVISQAMLIRNILRSGTLDLLIQKGHTIYIFLLCNEVPEYIKKEFANDAVTLIAVPDKIIRVGKIHKRFILFTHFLINNPSTKIYFSYSRHYREKPRIVTFVYLSFLTIFSTLSFLKPLVRWAELKFFKENNETIAGYFEAYKPDLLFSTGITTKIDNIFLKEAKRRNITTVSMTKSWDTATKMYYRLAPDYFLTQNEKVKEKLATLQDIPEKNIYVVGFPQFDWYKKEGIFKTKEEHLKSKGLDPNKPVIYFGSQGSWFKNDFEIARQIHTWIENNELAKPAQLIVRPHFSDVKTTRLRELKELPHVAYDDSYHISDVFHDNWDPLKPEIIDFANTLKHSDIVVVVLSTMALDAACFEKPIINTLFGGVYRRGKDITEKLSKVVHYQWVLKTNATSIVRSYDELKEEINKYLLDPGYKSQERKNLLREVCHKVDGGSSKRIADAIDDIIKK